MTTVQDPFTPSAKTMAPNGQNQAAMAEKPITERAHYQDRAANLRNNLLKRKQQAKNRQTQLNRQESR